MLGWCLRLPKNTSLVYSLIPHTKKAILLWKYSYIVVSVMRHNRKSLISVKCSEQVSLQDNYRWRNLQPEKYISWRQIPFYWNKIMRLGTVFLSSWALSYSLFKTGLFRLILFLFYTVNDLHLSQFLRKMTKRVYLYEAAGVSSAAECLSQTRHTRLLYSYLKQPCDHLQLAYRLGTLP